MRFTLSIQEKLKSSTAISTVFTGGTAIRAGALLMHVKVLPSGPGEPESVKVAFAVSKRRFKRSVDRNYIKRLMRESYRVRKFDTDGEAFRGKKVHMVISYIHSERPDFHQLAQQMEKVLARTLEHIRHTGI